MSDKTLLTREQILSAADTPTEVVDVPEWGGSVMVRTLTGNERDQLEQSFEDLNVDGAKKKDMTGIRAKYAALAIVDADGNNVFSFADVEALGKKSAKALDRVFEVCLRLSGVSAKDVEKLAGNSGGAQSGASTSG